MLKSFLFISKQFRLLDKLMCKYKSKKYIFINSITVIILLLLFLTLNPFYKETIALSPFFELQEITNENRQWVQLMVIMIRI